MKYEVVVSISLLVGISVGIRHDVCRVDSIKDGCICNKILRTDDLHFRYINRRVPIACTKPCQSLPLCDERTDNQLNDYRSTCDGITIVSREEWKAERPKHPLSIITKSVPEFYIHHTAGNQCDSIKSCAAVLRSIQQYHFSLGWSDIGYSFLVGQDARIYEGRGWNKVGAHTEGYNSISYAASFMGNYMTQLPNNQSINAVKLLIACGVNLGKIDRTYSLYGHRDACGDTDCPGDDLYAEIQGWKYYKRTQNPSAGCVAKGRRCKRDKNTCRRGSLIEGPSLCEGAFKNCCFK